MELHISVVFLVLLVVASCTSQVLISRLHGDNQLSTNVQHKDVTIVTPRVQNNNTCKARLQICQDRTVALELQETQVQEQIDKAIRVDSDLDNERMRLESRVEELQFLLDHPGKPIPPFPYAIGCVFPNSVGTVGLIKSKFSHCRGPFGALRSCIRRLSDVRIKVKDLTKTLNDQKQEVGVKARANLKIQQFIAKLNLQLQERDMLRNEVEIAPTDTILTEHGPTRVYPTYVSNV
ncbi:hypothetical protein B566_EDAN012573 [Ephemera danica]|nr:hypothetical protein B566_EDAN012573 [Ephemera danica]